MFNSNSRRCRQLERERLRQVTELGRTIVPPAGWRIEAHRPARKEVRGAAPQIIVTFRAPCGEQLTSLADIKAYMERARAAHGPTLPLGVSSRHLADLGKRARQVQPTCPPYYRQAGPPYYTQAGPPGPVHLSPVL